MREGPISLADLSRGLAYKIWTGNSKIPGKIRKSIPPAFSLVGNVITADFRRRTGLSIDIETSILFQDDQIVLMRCSFSMDGKAVPKLPPVHCIGNLLTGEVKSL